MSANEQNISKEMVRIAVNALQEKKGQNVRVIDISNVTVIADYFIIVNGTNVNQVQALVDSVQEELFKSGYETKRIEGYKEGSWVLLDYGDIIIHVFSEEDRIFYDLERIWRDGIDIDINNLEK